MEREIILQEGLDRRDALKALMKLDFESKLLFVHAAIPAHLAR
jgi:hypothetical protein